MDNKFLDKVGRDKAQLIMHTDPFDQHGPNLEALLHKFNLINGEVKLSAAKVEPQQLAMMYNVADVTINISDAEGFGLSTLESLSCGVPLILIGYKDNTHASEIIPLSKNHYKVIPTNDKDALIGAIKSLKNIDKKEVQEMTWEKHNEYSWKKHFVN